MFNSLIIRAGLISSFLINVENNMRCEDLIEISKTEYSIWRLSGGRHGRRGGYCCWQK